MTCLLGIDNGLTVTKAVVFDETGATLSVARRRVPQSMPQPRFVERDMDGLWLATAEAIREAVATSGRPASDIVAVAATAHGDGVYLLDKEMRPLRPGILSLDSRAGGLAEEWAATGVSAAALELTGQEPHASAPSSLLGWLQRHEPDVFARIGAVFACKDWLRFCLTGTLGTDRTEASTSFTDVRSQDYSPDVLKLYGLEALEGKLAPISGSTEIVGAVTAAAAAATGLRAGTPVAAGVHDVVASALGIGGHAPGTLTMVAGTYSINEILSDRPVTGRDWLTRNAVAPGVWNSMAISPASTANYDWFLDTFCVLERAQAEAQGGSVHEALAPELHAAMARPGGAFFHPFLFGSPHGSFASAGFLGLQGWHGRGDVLRAVLEGIVFNHRTHVDALRRQFPVREARVAGGGARNPVLGQMFADALNTPILVTSADEAAALGVALCAGVGCGLYPDLASAAARCTSVVRRYQPDADAAARLNERFALYTSLADALQPHWRAIDRLATSATGAPL